VLCCVILSVPVPICQCSVVWYCQCLYEYGSTLLCDIVSACSNLAVHCCVILSVSLPMWQRCVAWYVQCLTIVSVLCFVIMWVPVPMWLCPVLWYCQCLHECGSAFVTEHTGTSFNDVICEAVCSCEKKHSFSHIGLSLSVGNIHLIMCR